MNFARTIAMIIKTYSARARYISLLNATSSKAVWLLLRRMKRGKFHQLAIDESSDTGRPRSFQTGLCCLWRRVLTVHIAAKGTRLKKAARNLARAERDRSSRRKFLCRRSADRQRIDAQRRLADADRHRLAVLAAGADAGIELHIVAYHGDSLHGFGAVAD